MRATYSNLLLVALDILLKISLSAVSGVKSDFKFVDVLFKFLSDSHGLGFAFSFSFKTGLHGIKGTLVVASIK
jgi:hypothetical protein